MDCTAGWKADKALGSLRMTLSLHRGLGPSDTQQELQQIADHMPDVQYKQTCGHPQDALPQMRPSMNERCLFREMAHNLAKTMLKLFHLFFHPTLNWL